MWSNANQVGISSTVSATDTSASVSAGKLQSSTVACWELIWCPSSPPRSRVTLTVSSKPHLSRMSEWFTYCLLRAECYVFLSSPGNYKEYQWTGLNDKTIEDDFHWSDGNPLVKNMRTQWLSSYRTGLCRFSDENMTRDERININILRTWKVHYTVFTPQDQFTIWRGQVSQRKQLSDFFFLSKKITQMKS